MERIRGIRLANYIAGGIFEFGRLVSGRPGSGREFGDSTDWKITQPPAGLNPDSRGQGCQNSGILFFAEDTHFQFQIVP
jgi:hypothetical protein